MNTNGKQPPPFPGDPVTGFQGTKMGHMLNEIKNEVRTGATSQSEGRVAKAIETQTTKLPSDVFLWLALGSIGASAILQVMGQKKRSNFVAQWAPTLLILGLYNKMVKLHGSEGHHHD